MRSGRAHGAPKLTRMARQPTLGFCPTPCLYASRHAVHWRRRPSEENGRYVFAAAASPGGSCMLTTCGRPHGLTAPSRQHPHRANLSPTSSAILACHPTLSLNSSPVLCLSSCSLVWTTTNCRLAGPAIRREGRCMHSPRRSITTSTRRYPSVRCYEPRARDHQAH